jgi:hypothetical protein
MRRRWQCAESDVCRRLHRLRQGDVPLAIDWAQRCTIATVLAVRHRPLAS